VRSHDDEVDGVRNVGPTVPSFFLRYLISVRSGEHRHVAPVENLFGDATEETFAQPSRSPDDSVERSLRSRSSPTLFTVARTAAAE
jgi:hypothetical protein